MGEQEITNLNRKVEGSLIENEKTFRQLFETMSEGCALHKVIYDNHGKQLDYLIIDVNSAYETILGLKKDDVIGKKASEVYSSREPPYLDIYCEVASSGKPYSMEVYFPPMQKDFHISVFCPEKGYFATIFSDITAHKQMVDAVRRERDELDKITSDIGVGLTIISKDFRILWINKVLRDSFGEVEGKHCYSSFHGNSQICPECGVKQIFNLNKSQVIHEKTSSDTHGVTVCSQIIATPFKDKCGEIIGALEAVVPITELKQTEERLRESEAFNSSLLENAPNPIIVCNPDSSIRYVNPAFEHLTGFSRAELAGRNTPYPWWPEDKISDYRNQDPRIRTKEIDILEKYIVTKSGLPHWVVISEQQIKKEKQILYYIYIWVDITERKKVEDALKEEINTRARFIDILAHELRGPLSPILSSAEILKEIFENSTDDNLKRLSSNAYNGTLVLSKRLEELLDLARYSRGVFTLNTKPTDIARFIEEVISRFQPFIEQSGHKLAAIIPNHLPVIEIDRSRMEQVLINLLSNASKYSPINTRIELAVEVRDKFLLIEVKDKGNGMSDIDANNLFRPYHQLERDRNQPNGLGLGLSICKQIVEAHNGRIQVFSKLGQGSTFRISLPVKDNQLKLLNF
jgi:PAS domain S-box-containing protein